MRLREIKKGNLAILDVHINHQPDLITWVLQVISAHTHTPIEKIVMQSRKRESVWPRQVAHFFVRRLTNLSLYEIGWQIGGRDHATVINSCKTVKQLMDTDKQCRQMIYNIANNLHVKLDRKV